MRFLIPILACGAIGFLAGVGWPLYAYYSAIARNPRFDGGIATPFVLMLLATVPVCTFVGVLIGLLLALYEKFK
jgi:hypothetical protein